MVAATPRKAPPSTGSGRLLHGSERNGEADVVGLLSSSEAAGNTGNGLTMARALAMAA